MAVIPLFNPQHPQIRQLFTHLGQPVPSESFCREHVDKLAVDEKQRLKELSTENVLVRTLPVE